MGRENELSRLLRLIHRHRLVTLTGLGWAGKTQLALELSQRVGYRLRQVSALTHLGRVRAGRSVPEGLAHCRQALRLAHELGAKPYTLRTLTYLAELLLEHAPETSNDVAVWLDLVARHPGSEAYMRDRARSRLQSLTGFVEGAETPTLAAVVARLLEGAEGMLQT